MTLPAICQPTESRKGIASEPGKIPGSHPTSRFPILRRLGGAILLGIALALAWTTVEADRRIGALEAAAVQPGVDASGAPDPGDMEAFSPFSYAVVGPLRGDHSALELALSALRDSPAEVVLLRGPVLETPDDALPMAAVIRAAGIPIVAAPSARDLEGARGEAFERHISAHRWWFVRKDCLFTSVPPQGHADGFRMPERTFPSRVEVAPDDESTDVALEIVRVEAVGPRQAHASIVRARSTPAGVMRDLQLVALRPAVATGAGMAGLLAVAGLLATLGLVLLVPPRRE